MQRLFAFLLFTLPLPLFAQSVTLPAELRGDPGEPIIVAPEKIDGGALLKWEIDPALKEIRLDLLFGPELAAKAKGKLIIGKTPGRYRVRAWNAKGDVPSDLATCWIVIEGTAPPPPVPPTPPEPPPGPPPQAVATFIVGVTDNASRTLQQAAVLTDDALLGYLQDRKIGWRIIDINSPALRDYKLDAILAERKLAPPAVIAWGNDGSVRAAPAPSTSDGVKRFIEGKTFVRFEAERGLHYYQHGTTKRWLNRLAPSPQSAKALADCGIERWQYAKGSIPRDQWRTVTRRKLFGPVDWVLDQGQHGSCVGHGSVGALRTLRFCTGMRDRKLSPTCVYAQINGGRDDGAIIGDSLLALQKTGTILFSSTTEDRIYLHQMPHGWQTEAARFKIEQAYTTPTFDEIVSAIQLGYLVVFGMEVGNNFEAFDRFGVAGYSGGPGNHCLFIDGCTKLADGRWVVDVINSWGVDWGPWRNGRCYMTERHINNADNSDAYAIRTATEDPQETIKPPVK